MLNEKLKTSIGLKVIVIGGLILALLIPTLMVQTKIYEREERRAEVLGDITSKWGEVQHITGPVLCIPVEYIQKDVHGNKQSYNQWIYLLPDSIIIQGELDPKIRYRGIYQILLYTSNLQFSGNFNLNNLDDINLKDGEILYNQAILEFGIADMKGINERIKITWNKDKNIANPGIKYCTTLKKGFHFKSPLIEDTNQYHFSFSLNLNGSEEIRFTPIGKETQANITSKWQHPSFVGDFIPKEREINDKEFNAKWKVLNLNRNFPQFNFGNPIEFDYSFFGVQLFYPVDQYQKTTRTVKYAIMFIGLTFLAFFLIEILKKKLLHPFQYLLVGFGLVLFYILLLALSEHLNFPLAYILSSLSLILVISLYSRAILRDNRFMLLISSVLIILYGFLYVNLQLQDYALLLGSVGLFLILTLVMYITRHIDWFNVLNTKEDKITKK